MVNAPQFLPLWLGNIISISILCLALIHVFVHMSMFMLAMVDVVRFGSGRHANRNSTRAISLGYLVVYVTYNGCLYAYAISSINWYTVFIMKHGSLQAWANAEWVSPLFSGSSWQWIFYYESLTLLATTWLKVGCALFEYSKIAVALQSFPSSETNAANDVERQSEMPHVNVVMPVYNEPLDALLESVLSVQKNNYPTCKLELIMAFDDDAITATYLALVECLTGSNGKRLLKGKLKSKPIFERASENLGSYRPKNKHKASKKSDRDRLNSQLSHPPVFRLTFGGLNITLCRFAHGGKRNAQMNAYIYLDAIYTGILRKPILCFIDSDVQLHRDCIQYFVHELQTTTGREALTGLILTHTTRRTILEYLQNVEYMESQILHRTTEDYLGSVSCLPGALTMIRFESLNVVSRAYFAQRPPRNSIDFSRCHLGEDRYLTHLLMEARPEQHRIGFCAWARCRTEPCQTVSALFKQRRRWVLGTIANEVHMITSPILWKSMPALLILQSITSLRNGPLLVYAAVVECLLGRFDQFWSVGSLFIAYFSIWICLFVYARRLREYNVIWMFPLFLCVNPLLGACYSLYALMTHRRRTWGGPRTTALEEVPIFGADALEKSITRRSSMSREGPYDKSKTSSSKSRKQGSSMINRKNKGKKTSELYSRPLHSVELTSFPEPVDLEVLPASSRRSRRSSWVPNQHHPVLARFKSIRKSV